MRGRARFGSRLAPALVLALPLIGCFDTTASPRDGAPSAADAGPARVPPPPAASALDLLFVVDNAGSMTEEQAYFSAELPSLLRALASGDHDDDGAAEAAPFTSIHLGVVTTDMGTGGALVPTCANSDFGDDGVLRREGTVAIPGCVAAYPPFLAFAAGDDVDAVGADAVCLATAGTGGCGLEQPLEAALKALSPAAPTDWTRGDFVPPAFHGGTRGHADSINAGLVRSDSLLAVVVLTDEDDCSAADVALYDPRSPTYERTGLSMRCVSHPEAMHSASRYVQGLVQLRPHPDRLLYFVLAGVPEDLAAGPGEATRYPPLISADPAVRDPRMQLRVDPAEPNRRLPSCNEPAVGRAFPPVRLVAVAAGLERAGARTGVASVCTSELGGAVRSLLALTRR